mmetsp:Transcript_7558/g.11478  ORF Transcript_7558/g.11478 Transcript_7558/m.11478 type:complete len:306 (-) Transcript_7558:716-1633(-)
MRLGGQQAQQVAQHRPRPHPGADPLHDGAGGWLQFHGVQVVVGVILQGLQPRQPLCPPVRAAKACGSGGLPAPPDPAGAEGGATTRNVGGDGKQRLARGWCGQGDPHVLREEPCQEAGGRGQVHGPLVLVRPRQHWARLDHNSDNPQLVQGLEADVSFLHSRGLLHPNPNLEKHCLGMHPQSPARGILHHCLVPTGPARFGAPRRATFVIFFPSGALGSRGRGFAAGTLPSGGRRQGVRCSVHYLHLEEVLVPVLLHTREVRGIAVQLGVQHEEGAGQLAHLGHGGPRGGLVGALPLRTPAHVLR